MFFDILAVLVITFFAALGMVEFSDRILKAPFRKNIKSKIFIVANINFVKEEELEQGIWSVFTENRGTNADIILDLREAPAEKIELCENLRKKFEFYPLKTEDELLRFFKESLQKENNII